MTKERNTNKNSGILHRIFRRALRWGIANPHAVCLTGLSIILIFTGAFCLFYATLPDQPNGTEVVVQIIQFIGFWMNTVLVFLLCVAFLYWAGATVKGGVKVNIEWFTLKPDELAALPNGNEVFIFWNSPDDTTVADRLLSAKSSLKAGQCVCVVGFRNAAIQVFYSDDTFRVFTREDLPFYPADITDAQRIAPAGKLFTSETWGDYIEFINRFTPQFREYASRSRYDVLQEGTSVQQAQRIVLNTLSAAFVLILSLCPLLLSAQTKSERVREYLGQTRINDKPTGVAVFSFTGQVITRKADGTRTWVEVLKSGNYYSDKDDAGSLNSIQLTEGTQTIAIMPAAKKRPEKMEQPAKRIEHREANAESSALPIAGDSASIAMSIEDVKNGIDQGFDRMEQEAGKFWSIVIHVFRRAFYMILGLVGLLYFGAETAFNESRMSFFGGSIYGRYIQRFGLMCATMQYFVLMLWFLVVLTNIFIAMVKGSVGYIFSMVFSTDAVLCLAWFGVLWIAKTGMDKLIPNPKTRGGGGHHFGGGGPDKYLNG